MDNNRNLQTNLYKNHTKTKFMEENSMKKNNKNKANNKKRIVTSLLVVALALLMVVGVFMLSPMKASAATNRAGVYMLYGLYDIGDGATAGYMDQFAIQISTQYFRDDASTTTKYNYATYDWSYFSFYIHAEDIKEHVSFKLTRNGSTYTSKSLSGSGGGYLYQGSLSDGDYVLTYVGEYKPNIFVTKTYTFTYHFTVDTTAPYTSFTAGGSSISSGAYTNKEIKFSATDNYSTSKIYYRSPSASSYTYTTASSKSVSATSANNGWWYFYATDGYQSSSTYSVYLDTVAPVGKATNSSGTTISNGGYTNKPVKYSATDTGGVSYYQVKNPGSSSWSSYTANTALSASTGWYTFRAVDKAGNISSEYKVYYDATAPSGTLYGGTTVKSTGGYSNASYVKYVASDSHSGVANCYVRKPGSSSYVAYTSGTQLTAEGTYYFYCTDKSGNTSSTVSITLDRTAPTGTLYGGTATKTSGSYTNASYVKYTATDSTSGINALYVKMPGSSYYTAYSSGTQLATEGTYSFYATDKAGNQSSVVTITLDVTKPTGVLYGGTSVISSGDSTNASYVKFVPSDNIGLANIYVKKPNTTTYAAYTSGTQLTAEGTYTFYATDKAGNTSAYYTVKVDRQIPSAQLYVDGKAISSGSYTNGEYIKFVCGEDCYVKTPDSSTFTAYVSGTEFSKAGKYTFYGLDDAGNSTGNYTVIIDRTQKKATLSGVSGGKTNGDVKITWSNGDANLYAPVKSVTVNGKSVTNGKLISTIDTGVYKVVVTDTAGNVWSTEFVSSKQNVQTSTLQKEYYEVADKDGNIFAFASYEKALEFATLRENGLVVNGTWSSATWDTGIAMDEKDSANAVNGAYFIYKKSGSPDEQVAYFTAERLAEVIAEYAEDSIKSYYYWQKAPATVADGENLYTYSEGKNILANKVEFGTDVGLLLDGEEFVGNVIETEGKHTVTVFDEFGNTCDYSVIIIRNAPSIQYAIGEGATNNVSFDRTYFFKDEVTVSITEALDEMAMFRIYRVIDEDESELVAIKSLGESFTLTESGTYTVVAVNHAGDSQSFNLVISRSAPSVTLTEDAEKKQLVIEVKPSADVESHIQTLIVQKSTDGGSTWVTLDTDDYGTAIELDTLTYKFRTSGIYKVTITDEFRTGIDSIIGEKNYTQPAPTGELEGVDNGGHTNGIVKFSWDDDAKVTVTKDGEEIEYRSGVRLTEDGDYTIVFENHDGHKTTYTFTIDTEAPEISVDGAKAEGATNTNVSVTFEGEGVTATLEKNDTEVSDYASGTVVSEDGKYTVIVTDEAGNETKTSFVIDKSVSYDVNINDGGLANSVTIYEKENLEFVVTKNGTPIEYKDGTAITEPAEYTVTLTDDIGNKAEFSFTIVEPVVTKFTHNFDELAGFEKVLVNGNEARLNYGTLEITADGKYTVDVVANGETHSFSVTVDTKVDYSVNAHDKGFANSVKISANESVTATVTKNGEAFKYELGKEITEPATYGVKLVDALGNKVEFSFTIVEPTVGKFEEEIDLIPGFEKVLVNGNETTIEKGTLALTESGVYEVSIIAGGKTQKFTVTVDATAPTLTLNGVENGGATTDAVTLTDVSEEAEVVVTLNGEQIEYTVGDELTEIGEYKVTVTDAYGNATEYDFTIEKGANIALIVILIILGVAAIGTGVFFYFKKKNSI